MSHYIAENHEFGELRGVYTSSAEDQFMIDDAIDMTSDFDERFMTDFLTVVEQNFERVSFLTKIYVNPEHRGHGFGAQMLDSFLDKVKESELIFLLARVSNPQAKGFDLIDFYCDRGFCPIKLSDGDLLMVDKKNFDLFKTTLDF
ncbi:GNAT family N-acetyltransferase [Vibrio parahaemolyticus]|nr:GNAT family N-acetyltransferase [Vibrio parahaemolyticus]